MVLRTFAEAFPHVSVWNMQESDYLLIGAESALPFDYAKATKVFAENKTLKADFQSLGLSDPYALLGFYRMGKKELQALCEGADLNTDDNVRLEFSAPRSLGKTTSELNRNLMEPFVVAPSWHGSSKGVSKAQHHFFIAEAYHAGAAYDDALKELNEAIRLEPKKAEYHLLRTQILSALDLSKEAFEAAEKALDLGTKETERVILTVSENFYTRDAKVIYHRMVGGGSTELLPYLGLANIALHEKKITEAERWLEKAAKINNAHAGYAFARGKLEVAKKNFPEALRLFKEAQKYGEDSASLYHEMAHAYGEIKQWEESARFYELALRRHRRNVSWRLEWARALQHLGRSRAAEEKYRDVLALDPNLGDAWRGLNSLGKRY
jgi:tetratricopeptide (TPR) repeat protein